VDIRGVGIRRRASARSPRLSRIITPLSQEQRFRWRFFLSLFFLSFRSLPVFICSVSVHADLARARSRSSRQDLRATLMICPRRNNYSSSACVTTMTSTTTFRRSFFDFTCISPSALLYLYRGDDSLTRWSDADRRCNCATRTCIFLCPYLDVDDRPGRFFNNNNETGIAGIAGR